MFRNCVENEKKKLWTTETQLWFFIYSKLTKLKKPIFELNILLPFTSVVLLVFF